MKLLILGGTRFVGRHLVDALLARGHELTLFHRGRSGTAPPGVQVRLGDRREDLSALEDGRWDAVIDTCGYIPREVRDAAERLAGRVERYIYVSSVSAYASHDRGPREDEPLATIPDPETEIVDGRTYGALKALSEAELAGGAFAGRSLIVRPGLVVGPWDPTQRFTYWPARLGRATDGEPVLAPGTPDTAVQWIDARDLAAFVADQVEKGGTGVFNVVDTPTTMGELLQLCADASRVRPDWRWMPRDWLLARSVTAWNDLPLVLPDEPGFGNFCRVDASRARAAGLLTRSRAATVADTLAWWRSLPADQQGFDKAGLSPDRERELLAAWARDGET